MLKILQESIDAKIDPLHTCIVSEITKREQAASLTPRPWVREVADSGSVRRSETKHEV